MNRAYGIPLGSRNFEKDVNRALDSFAKKNEATKYDLVDRWPEIRYGESEATHLLIGSADNDYESGKALTSITWCSDIMWLGSLTLLNERNFPKPKQVS
jgi:hypothetical protein